MKFESYARERVIAPAEAAGRQAIDDVVELAQANARKHSRTGRFERSIRANVRETAPGKIEARIGSPLSSAGIKERGGTIRARNAPYLHFPVGGRWARVEQVYVPPTPSVGPAVEQFPRIAEDALREAWRG